MDMDAIQSSISGYNVERVEYVDSDSDSGSGDDAIEIGSLDASNPYLNFSFMNLPNLQALSQETFVKNSPRGSAYQPNSPIRPSGLKCATKENSPHYSDCSDSTTVVFDVSDDSSSSENYISSDDDYAD